MMTLTGPNGNPTPNHCHPFKTSQPVLECRRWKPGTYSVHIQHATTGQAAGGGMLYVIGNYTVITARA